MIEAGDRLGRENPAAVDIVEDLADPVQIAIKACKSQDTLCDHGFCLRGNHNQDDALPT